MADQAMSAATETMYRVRRGGTRRPVGTLLTTSEFEAIHNGKALLETGYLVVVRVKKESGK